MHATRKKQYSDYVAKELAAQMQVAFQQARKQLAKSAKRQVAQHEKVTKVKELQVWHLVYLYVPQVKKGCTKKMSRLNQGPFRILKRISEVNYDIQPVTGRGFWFRLMWWRRWQWKTIPFPVVPILPAATEPITSPAKRSPWATKNLQSSAQRNYSEESDPASIPDKGSETEQNQDGSEILGAVSWAENAL